MAVIALNMQTFLILVNLHTYTNTDINIAALTLECIDIDLKIEMVV